MMSVVAVAAPTRVVVVGGCDDNCNDNGSGWTIGDDSNSG